MHLAIGDTWHSRWIHTKKTIDYHGDFVESVLAPIHFVYNRTGGLAHASALIAVSKDIENIENLRSLVLYFPLQSQSASKGPHTEP